MNFFKIQVSKDGAGFTLIEMLVVVVIFSIIIGAIIGVFVSAIRTQKYCLVAQQLLDQTGYAMEYTSRFLRMAKKDLAWGCIPDRTNYQETSRGKKGIRFNNYKKECQEFFWDTDDQLKDYREGRGPEVLSLTSESLEVKNFNLHLLGHDSQTDGLQPRVTFFLEIEGTGSRPRPRIRIQTTVSQRDLDFPGE